MKHKNSAKGFLAAVLLLCSASSWAASYYDFEAAGIYYDIISSSERTCEVSYYSPTINSDGNQTKYIGSYTIPETVTYNGKLYTVIGIGQKAFHNCTSLTDVTIPTTVTYIESQAFYKCSGLTEVTVPNSITTIGDYAFQDCTGLTGITLPQSITSLGSYAFDGCSSVTEVIIPNGLEVISSGTFRGCSLLEKVTIPNSVISISSSAFSNCSSLTEVTIPNSVSYLGENVFINCGKLATLTLEDSEEPLTMETTSSSSPFIGCPIKTLYLGRDISCSVSNSPFKDDTSLEFLTISNKVTYIDTYEFYGCTALAELNIPNSVTSIGTYAFYNCSGLAGELYIPNSVTSIGSYSFYGCSSLFEISVGTGVTSIGNYAFRGCSPENMYFLARMDDYYLVFNGLTCGTLYAHEDQVEAIEKEYSGTVVPLEDVYTLSVNAAYPRTLVLEANANEKLMTEGVSLKSVNVGRTTVTAGADGLYVAKNLLPSTTYTCTLTFMYGTEERTDELTVTTENFCDEATVQSVTQFSATFAITLNEDLYSDGPDEYGLADGSTYYPAEADGTVFIAGLVPETEYFFDLYANYDNVTMKGGSVSATTDELILPTVTTAEATDVTATSATLHGSVTAGTEDIKSQGFEYWTSEDVVLTVEAEDMFATVTDLTPCTTYYYRAYAETEYSGMTYGETVSFTTLIVAPTVQTLSATDITHNSATLNGTVNAGSEKILEQGFDYWLATSSASNAQTVIGSGEEMSITITGLKTATTYIFCAYVRTESKTYYGEERAFTTTAVIPPTVQTYAASDITSTTAVLNGYVEMASEEIEEQGFEYWSKDMDAQLVATTGDYMSVMITGLKANTTYTFRAYATTVSGTRSTTTFGDNMTFTTDVLIAPTVQTNAAENVTSSSATLSGEVTAGSEEIEEQGFEYWTDDGDVQIITSTKDYMSETITGLTLSTTYTYRAYARTASGTTYGVDVSFTTLDYADGVSDVNAELDVEARYTTDGKKISKPVRGINIIRYSDGTARKVLMK